MIFISSQILLVQVLLAARLEVVCRVSYRLTRLIRQPMNALCRIFGHKVIGLTGLSRIFDARACAHNACELFMLVAPFHTWMGSCYRNLLLARLLTDLNETRGRFLGAHAFLVLPTLGNTSFGNSEASSVVGLRVVYLQLRLRAWSYLRHHTISFLARE